MKILTLKPIGFARLAQSPILPSNIFSPTVEPALGVPRPSTILGLMGSVAGIRLSKDTVIRDPLLGLGVLVDELSKKLKPVKGSLLAGPFIKVKNFRGKHVLAVPIFSKSGTFLVDIKALSTIAKNLMLNDEFVFGVVRNVIDTGIHLEDYESEGRRVVKQGYTFKRLFTYVLDTKGVPVDYEFVYIIDPIEELPAHVTVRLGGEQRQAIYRIEDFNMFEGSEELKKLIEKLSSIDIIEEFGTFILLTPAPLIPIEEQIYYSKEKGFVPWLNEVLGVVTKSGTKPYVVRLGLGYSEVFNVRRPQVLALPSGTLIKVREKIHINNLILKLARAGYYQMLRLE